MAKRTIKGTVVSNKMEKTVVVAVHRMVSHPLYGKKMRKTTKFKADNNGFTPEIGEVVTIEETRPMSKTKRFKVVGKEEKR